MFETAVLVIIAVAVVGALASISYVKAPPNMAYIISGLGKEPRILIGQAGFKLPFLERIDFLELGQMSVDIKTEQSVPTNDFISVNVDAVAKVRVIPTPEGIRLAAKNFLNYDLDSVAAELKDSLQGNMREIIGTLDLLTINTNRDAFSDQVMDKAQKDMSKLGIEVISCNIQNVTDESGLIRDLGADNSAKIQKNASIARANANRDVAIAQASADREANEARVAADKEIAAKKNELALAQAELMVKENKAKAVADASYAIESQEQRKIIEATTVNADIAKMERETELKEREVSKQEQILNATIRKQAEADKYSAEQKAEADLEVRKREAEAAAYEKAKEAEAQKAIAEANKFAMEQEAAGIRAKGEAEAAAIKAKGEAEAAAMEKKADAYNKYNKAAVAEMVVKIMPQVAAEIAKPLSSIDKVTIIGGGNGVGEVANSAPLVMAKLFQTMKETTGVDLGEILKADTYDAKVTRNINVKKVSDDTHPGENAAIASAVHEVLAEPEVVVEEPEAVVEPETDPS